MEDLRKNDGLHGSSPVGSQAGEIARVSTCNMMDCSSNRQFGELERMQQLATVASMKNHSSEQTMPHENTDSPFSFMHPTASMMRSSLPHAILSPQASLPFAHTPSHYQSSTLKHAPMSLYTPIMFGNNYNQDSRTPMQTANNLGYHFVAHNVNHAFALNLPNQVTQQELNSASFSDPVDIPMESAMTKIFSSSNPITQTLQSHMSFSRQFQADAHVNDITMDDLRPHFNKPILAAAREFGVCITLMKKICRKNGILRWPHRRIRSLVNRITSGQVVYANSTGGEKMKLEVQLNNLREELAQVIKNPNSRSRRGPSHPKHPRKCSSSNYDSEEPQIDDDDDTNSIDNQEEEEVREREIQSTDSSKVKMAFSALNTSASTRPMPGISSLLNRF